MGLAVAGAGAACALNPRLITYFKNGQLRFPEWAMLAGGSATGYFVGGTAGPMMFGDAQAVKNHWLAYTFVKSMNRYEGRQILGKTPTY